MKRLIKFVLAALLLANCANAQPVEINSVGASFPYPLYSKMFDEYKNLKGIQVNYQALGSGAGIKNLRQRLVDFAPSDSFLTDGLIDRIFASKSIIHIPICSSAVALAFNLEGVDDLKLDSDAIAQIYLGKIKRWSDPKIKALNPAATLPDLPIIPVRREDSSGTTFIFTDYLSKTNTSWAREIGRGKTMMWPVGVSAESNEGVADLVKTVPGSIAYMVSSFASQRGLSVVSIKNMAGNFVAPTLDGVSNASDSSKMSKDTRVIITNTDNPKGYPISSLTWILLYKEQYYNERSKEQALETYRLLKWMISDGQEYAKPLQYAPLSKSMRIKAHALLNGVTYKGRKISSLN